MRILHWASRLFLAALFLYSGYAKLQPILSLNLVSTVSSYNLQFAATISSYKLVPDSWVVPMAQYLPWFEIVLGIMLLIGWQLRYVALATLALLAFFTVVLTITWFRGIDADCGCFGAGGGPITPLTIARDSLFLLPAVYLALDFRGRRLRSKVQSVVQ